jgi:hypothetical protein
MPANGQTAAGVTVPDTKLAREATELVRDRTSDLIYHHSRRVYWWGSVQGLGDTGRAAITALHPRPDFKRNILQAFTDGMAPKPDTTFGTVNADVLERYVPGFQRANFVDIILDSDWPE